ncbi:MAG: type 1 glutamine amidotransferase [Elusimicrobia bacterium]|nr:type 1 glutamine amidotransferase [Candidatus Liberimonas magnetica]
MNKIAILVEDNYQTLEVWYPFLRLKEENIEAVFIGTGRKEEYKSKEGYPVKVDGSIIHINPNEFGGVLIPGGYAPDILRRYAEVNEFVANMFTKGKLTAAICHGGWVLVSSGVLKGKKATGFFAIKDDMVNAGAEFINKEVVVDNNLITSRNPYDLPYFLKEILKFLKIKNH